MISNAATPSKILVTGASGFVGSHLVSYLLSQGHQVRVCSRRDWPDAPAPNYVIGNINGNTDWQNALQDIDVVIHCAARVHIMNDTAADPLQAFREVNRDASVRLAQQAAQAGVKQLIYLSSVKVNGEMTELGTPFTENDIPAPSDPYGISKLEAEQALLAIGEQCSMKITVIRPPLIYGAGVGANFLSLLRWVKKGIPLPLGAIHNRRSFVFVKNLVSFIAHCMLNPAAYQQRYLISDGHDLSTTELLKAAAEAQQVPARLVPIPASWISGVATLIGRKSISDRLCMSLQVDINKAKNQLHWQPPFSVAEGLRECTIPNSQSKH